MKFEELSVEELEGLIRYHDNRYWLSNAPEISDYEYDQLVELLRAKKPGSPLLKQVASEDLSTHGEKVTHQRPMLSLDKCYADAELLHWFDKFDGDAVVSPKVDGVAAAIRYDEDGVMQLAATRGNGRVGELITGNMRQVAFVPDRIDLGSVEVRGEVYMPLSIFRSQFMEQFANPRNLTAGAIKLKEFRDTGKYGLCFMAYDVDLSGTEHRGVQFEMEKHGLLCALGFNAVPQSAVDRAGCSPAFQQFLAEREGLNYETDGVVYRANNIGEQKRMGYTSHHPRYAMAYKYQGDSGTSQLLEVEWSVSRTGAINPVAIVTPVSLSGATVTRASLHNLSMMEKLGGEAGLSLGSKVLMMRRGGVIPHVEKVLEKGDRPVQRPDGCPSCGGKTFVEKQEKGTADVLKAHHTTDCGATRLGSLQHFLQVVDVRGFGPKLLEQLIALKIVSSPSELFKLDVNKLCELERVGEKLATRLVEELNSARQITLSTFLTALGIPELGPVVARSVSHQYISLEVLQEASASKLSEIDGVGDVIAQNIVLGLESRRFEIEKLREEISVERDEAPSGLSGGGLLRGKKILFTGELSKMKRKEAQELVRENGGETPGSVVKDLSYLVLGDRDHARYVEGWRSGKLKKAEKLIEAGAAIEILSEAAFFEKLEAS